VPSGTLFAFARPEYSSNFHKGCAILDGKRGNFGYRATTVLPPHNQVSGG
jgi:hypothetical protein